MRRSGRIPNWTSSASTAASSATSRRRAATRASRCSSRLSSTARRSESSALAVAASPSTSSGQKLAPKRALPAGEGPGPLLEAVLDRRLRPAPRPSRHRAGPPGPPFYRMGPAPTARSRPGERLVPAPTARSRPGEQLVPAPAARSCHAERLVPAPAARSDPGERRVPRPKGCKPCRRAPSRPNRRASGKLRRGRPRRPRCCCGSPR